MNVISYVVPMFLDNAQTNIEVECVLSKNIRTTYQLCSSMDQFVHYIHWKVCKYQMFNIIAQYVWKIMS